MNGFYLFFQFIADNSTATSVVKKETLLKMPLEWSSVKQLLKPKKFPIWWKPHPFSFGHSYFNQKLENIYDNANSADASAIRLTNNVFSFFSREAGIKTFDTESKKLLY